MRVAGIMSGTSLDGVDVAVVDIRGRGWTKKISTVATWSRPYPRQVRKALLGVSNCETHTLEISRLNVLLGELYGAAVLAAGVDGIDLIGCHGQTIYHQSGAHTLQIGEAAVIAERTGIPVVSNFRARDIAAGGTGAPLVPYVDYLLLRHPRRHRVAVNIGGIGNITSIPAGAAPEDVTAFDTGPGNMVIDALVRKHTGALYDRDGRIASRGTANERLIERLLRTAYFKAPPPKSAGREQYGQKFLSHFDGLKPADAVATATALTAASIALGIGRFTRGPVDDVIVSGGGAHNPRLMAYLAALLPSVQPASDFGVDIDFKEAIAFAILAYETWHRRPSNLPAATGARRPVILGDLTPY
jgi:anhydro-N-acetylmuramic acid kinase